MKLERINTAKGFCAKRSQRIPELHRNNKDLTSCKCCHFYEFKSELLSHLSPSLMTLKVTRASFEGTSISESDFFKCELENELMLESSQLRSEKRDNLFN